MDYILCPRLLLPGNVPCGVQQEIHHGLKKRSMYVEIHHHNSTVFFILTDKWTKNFLSLDDRIVLGILVFNLFFKTCSIKSPFVFQYINKKFLFFLPVDNFTSALHYMNCILYQTFQKMNYVSTKNWNKSYTHRVKPYLCDHFSVIIFVKISTSVKKKYKIIN